MRKKITLEWFKQKIDSSVLITSFGHRTPRLKFSSFEYVNIINSCYLCNEIKKSIIMIIFKLYHRFLQISIAQKERINLTEKYQKLKGEIKKKIARSFTLFCRLAAPDPKLKTLKLIIIVCIGNPNWPIPCEKLIFNVYQRLNLEK